MANSVVRPHVPEEELHAYCDGELSPPQRIEIAEHLLGCLICRAQHAEVEVLRTRTSALLAVAAPRVIRGPSVRRIGQPATRRRLTGLTAAAAAAIIGLGVWYSVTPSHGVIPTTSSAAQLGAPIAATDASPVSGPGWRSVSWNDAVKAGEGAVASMPSLPVTRVVMHEGDAGSRPTFLVRQRLVNGHDVWIVDAPVAEFAGVAQMIAQGGASMSAAVQTRPRYVGTSAEIARSIRSYAVVGHADDQLGVLSAAVRP